MLLMNSSKKRLGDTLATRNVSGGRPAPNAIAESSDKELLDALVDLANLRDDEASFKRLEAKWSGFVRVDERERPFWNSVLRSVGPSFLSTQFHHMYRRREAVRRIWRGDSEMLVLVLLPEVPPEESTDQEKYVEKVDAKGLPIDLARPSQVRFDWQRGQLVYEPLTEFQRSLYALFQRSALAKVCANGDCPAPYFIATKVSQRYCSEKCAEVFQRKWKRQWWTEHGDDWRRSRRRPRQRRSH